MTMDMIKLFKFVEIQRDFGHRGSMILLMHILEYLTKKTINIFNTALSCLNPDIHDSPRQQSAFVSIQFIFLKPEKQPRAPRIYNQTAYPFLFLAGILR